MESIFQHRETDRSKTSETVCWEATGRGRRKGSEAELRAGAAAKNVAVAQWLTIDL